MYPHACSTVALKSSTIAAAPMIIRSSRSSAVNGAAKCPAPMAYSFVGCKSTVLSTQHGSNKRHALRTSWVTHTAAPAVHVISKQEVDESKHAGQPLTAEVFNETMQQAAAELLDQPSPGSTHMTLAQAAANLTELQLSTALNGRTLSVDEVLGQSKTFTNTTWREPSPTSSIDELIDIRTAAVPESSSPTKAAPTGINIRAAAACTAIGLAVRFVVPIPPNVAASTWTLFSVFCTTIAGLILEPMPVSAWSLCCVTTLLATKAVTFQAAMSGLTNEAIWVIVFAFMFARAFEKTGLGERIANTFVAVAGSSSLGIAYSLAVAETLMSPAMPSCTARAGGIFMPVINFLAKSQNSEPKSGRKRLGAFLVHSQMQVSSNIAALFMTGAAQNLLAINIARSMGVIIPDVWATWALGAAVPGLLSVAMLPAIMFHLMPPEVRNTPEAPAQAHARLKQLGPLSKPESITLFTLAGAVVCWVFGEQLGCSAVLGAMLALSSLLLTGVLEWKDCLEYTPAWDTLLWFAVLMSMCSALATSGLVGQMADAVGQWLLGAALPWQACFGLLHAVFFWSHYLFASQVGHVGALYGAFLAMMMAAGVPTTLAAMTLGYSSNLFGSLTHYASGPAAVFHSSGYTRLGEVMKAGLLMGLRSWVVWGVVGMIWWKFLGWW